MYQWICFGYRLKVVEEHIITRLAGYTTIESNYMPSQLPFEGVICYLYRLLPEPDTSGHTGQNSHIVDD